MKQFVHPPCILLMLLASLYSSRLAALPGGKTNQLAHNANELNCTYPLAIWTADFSLPDGVTAVDTGYYRWTSAHTGASTTRFSVLNNEFRVNNSKQGKEGTWSSAIVDIAGKTNVTISVEVRSGVDARGSLEADTTPHSDYIRMYYKLDDGAEVLFGEFSGAINNNSTISTTISTASLTGSTLQVIIRSRASATDEYYYFDNVKISAINTVNVQANAITNGILTCARSTVMLAGSSSTPGVSYSWSGPNGFTAATQNTVVNTEGWYTLTVTELLSGCTVTTTTVVTANTRQPDKSASSNNNLTCRKNSTELKGSSATTGVTYNWAGPDGFTAAAALTIATAPGPYTLTVTDTTNGCTGDITIIVTQDTTHPAAMAGNNGPLSCATPEVTLTGSSAATGLTWLWSGPDGFSEPTQQCITTTPGTYTLIVTDTRVEGNGCQAIYTTQVTEDFSDCFAANTNRKAGNSQPAAVK